MIPRTSMNVNVLFSNQHIQFLSPVKPRWPSSLWPTLANNHKSWWVKTIGTYSLTVVESASLRTCENQFRLAVVKLSRLLSGGSRENPVPCLVFSSFWNCLPCVLWLMAPSSLKPEVWHLQVSPCASLSQGHLRLHLGPLKIIQYRFPISESSLTSTKVPVTTQNEICRF